MERIEGEREQQQEQCREMGADTCVPEMAGRLMWLEHTGAGQAWKGHGRVKMWVEAS